MDCFPPGSPVHRDFQQTYWSGLPCPLLEDLPRSRIEAVSLALVGGFFTAEPLGTPVGVLGKCQRKPLRHTALWVRAEIQISVMVISSLVILPSSLPSDEARKFCV